MGTDIHAVFVRNTETGYEFIESKWEQHRCYRLFAWLANVRNGFGFAGVYTHEPIEPISNPRGFPQGFNVDEYEDHTGNWLGDHSFSHLTLDEILIAPIPKTRAGGVITIEQYRKWDGKRPESWCGSVEGDGIIVSDPHNITEKTTEVRVTWEEDWAELFKEFLDEIKRLRAEYGNIMMVFGFDS